MEEWGDADEQVPPDGEHGRSGPATYLSYVSMGEGKRSLPLIPNPFLLVVVWRAGPEVMRARELALPLTSSSPGGVDECEPAPRV